MTDESDHSDGVIQHPLSWRSQGWIYNDSINTLHSLLLFIVGLDKLVKKIDKRRASKEKKRSGGFKTKLRIPGSPSPLSPPPDGPKWAVNGTPMPARRHSSLNSGGTSQNVTPGSGQQNTLRRQMPRRELSSGQQHNSTPSGRPGIAGMQKALALRDESDLDSSATSSSCSSSEDLGHLSDY